jgi:hypothetical protein
MAGSETCTTHDNLGGSIQRQRSARTDWIHEQDMATSDVGIVNVRPIQPAASLTN